MHKIKLAGFVLLGILILSVFSVYVASAGTDSNGDGWVYWTGPTFNSISRTSLDGKITETIFTAADGAYDTKYLAIDFDEDQLYWTGESQGGGDPVIKYANLDGTGSGQTVVVQEFGAPIYQVVLDTEADQMFWNIQVAPTGVIDSSHLDGSGEEQIYFGVTPTALALNPEQEKLYYAITPGLSCASESKIQRANYDGSSGEDLIGGLKWVRSMAINPLNGDIYFSEQCGVNTIKRITADGKVETIISGEAASSISLDLTAGKLYWSKISSQAIRRANLDGSEAEDVHTVSGFDFIGGIAVLPDFTVEDLNQDGIVNGHDLAILLGEWGTCSPRGDCSADLDRNGIVDGHDLAMLLAAWS